MTTWPVSLGSLSGPHQQSQPASLPRMSSHVNKLETLFLFKLSVKIFLQPAVCIICVTSERLSHTRAGLIMMTDLTPGPSSFQ